jgi:hypothetical protein
MSPRRRTPRLDPVTLLLRLRSELASANLMLAIYRLADVCRKFDPDQPRVPAGQPGGGQWTSGAGGAAGGGGAEPSRTITDESGEQPWSEITNSYGEDGSVASQTVANRDGSTITSDFAPTDDYDERHTVQLPDGEAFSFENDGPTQTIRDANTGQIISKTTWGPDGPEAEPIIEPAFAPAVPAATKLFVEVGVPAAILAAKTLYDWYAGQDNGAYKDDGKRTVASFRAYDFDTADNARIAPDYVGRVDKRDVDDACPRHGEVQDRTDTAYDRAMKDSTYPNAAEKGKAIHLQLKKDIDSLDDPDLRAEVSILKSGDGRNKKGSVRVDVLERVGNGTVCVYDLKTGNEPLYPGRSIEIARNVHKYYEDTTRILLIETRPRR